MLIVGAVINVQHWRTRPKQLPIPDSRSATS
jgi:hypothetical protein